MSKLYLKFLLTLITVSLFTSGFSQQTKILSAEKHNEYGLVYSLPVTAFRIEVTIATETQVAGPFYKYSKLFAGTSDVITKNSRRQWVEDVKVTPYGIPNPDEKYLMQLKPGATTFIAVADDNMLLAINKDNVKYSAPLSASAEKPSVQPQPDINDYLKYVTEDFISAISDYKKAQLLGEELMEIKEAKISLTRGTAETMPTDGRQLEIMLNSLEDQENSLMNAFRGVSFTSKEVRTYTFIPNPQNDEMSKYLTDVNLKLEITELESPLLPLDAKGEEKKLPKDAVIYRIPGTVRLTVSNDNRQLYSNVFEIAQTGVNFGLSPTLFTDKKEPSYAIFDPVNGALRELGTIK